MSAPSRSKYAAFALAGTAQVTLAPYQFFGGVLSVSALTTGIFLPTAGAFSAAQQAQLQGARILLHKQDGAALSIKSEWRDDLWHGLSRGRCW